MLEKVPREQLRALTELGGQNWPWPQAVGADNPARGQKLPAVQFEQVEAPVASPWSVQRIDNKNRGSGGGGQTVYGCKRASRTG